MQSENSQENGFIVNGDAREGKNLDESQKAQWLFNIFSTMGLFDAK